jgi:hypothetical protein
MLEVFRYRVGISAYKREGNGFLAQPRGDLQPRSSIQIDVEKNCIEDVPPVASNAPPTVPTGPTASNSALPKMVARCAATKASSSTMRMLHLFGIMFPMAWVGPTRSTQASN